MSIPHLPPSPQKIIIKTQPSHRNPNVVPSTYLDVGAIARLRQFYPTPVVIFQTIVDEGCQPWKLSLIGKFLRRPFATVRVFGGLSALWNPQGEWELFVGKREFTDGEVDKDRQGSSSDRQGSRRRKAKETAAEESSSSRTGSAVDRPARSTARAQRAQGQRAVDRPVDRIA